MHPTSVDRWRTGTIPTELINPDRNNQYSRINTMGTHRWAPVGHLPDTVGPVSHLTNYGQSVRISTRRALLHGWQCRWCTWSMSVDIRQSVSIRAGQSVIPVKTSWLMQFQLGLTTSDDLLDRCTTDSWGGGEVHVPLPWVLQLHMYRYPAVPPPGYTTPHPAQHRQ